MKTPYNIVLNFDVRDASSAFGITIYFGLVGGGGVNQLLYSSWWPQCFWTYFTLDMFSF